MKIRTLLLMFCLGSPALAQPADWDPKFYNPNPANGDLLLPLPCGGKLAFRPVEVPTENGPLEDRTVPMGDPDRSLGVAEYVHNENLAGPFPFSDGARGYWIGKYVVTRDQFAAMHATCSTPGFGGRVAKTDVSQIEAIEAIADWSAWLLTNARNQLPKRGQELAYVRLPTEVEWEFAARGGTNVSAQAFQGRTWPMPQGIEHYTVSGSAASGRPQQIGVEALPNPLGLYNVLGSVDQMMLEPFRLNRVGRLHGDAGGIILRGGNYKDQPAELHTGMRSEMRPFDTETGRPLRLPTVGFRVVLSAPTGGDIPEVEAERQAFGNLITQHAAAFETEDASKLVEAMRKDATNPMETRALDQLDAKLASNERTRADQDRAVLRAEIEAAATIASFLWRLEKNIRATDAMIGYIEASTERRAAQSGATELPASVLNFEASQRKVAENIRLEQEASLDGYLAFLRQIALGPGRQDIQGSATLIRQEMGNRGQKQLQGFLDVVTRHVAALRDTSTLPRDSARNDILAVPDASQR
jgi:formylglycine-generating enzyme required for sulfatase activity